VVWTPLLRARGKARGCGFPKGRRDELVRHPGKNVDEPGIAAQVRPATRHRVPRSNEQAHRESPAPQAPGRQGRTAIRSQSGPSPGIPRMSHAMRVWALKSSNTFPQRGPVVRIAALTQGCESSRERAGALLPERRPDRCCLAWALVSSTLQEAAQPLRRGQKAPSLRRSRRSRGRSRG